MDVEEDSVLLSAPPSYNNANRPSGGSGSNEGGDMTRQQQAQQKKASDRQLPRFLQDTGASRARTGMAASTPSTTSLSSAASSSSSRGSSSSSSSGSISDHHHHRLSSTASSMAAMANDGSADNDMEYVAVDEFGDYLHDVLRYESRAVTVAAVNALQCSVLDQSDTLRDASAEEMQQVNRISDRMKQLEEQGRAQCQQQLDQQQQQLDLKVQALRRKMEADARLREIERLRGEAEQRSARDTAAAVLEEEARRQQVIADRELRDKARGGMTKRVRAIMIHQFRRVRAMVRGMMCWLRYMESIKANLLEKDALKRAQSDLLQFDHDRRRAKFGTLYVKVHGVRGFAPTAAVKVKKSSKKKRRSLSGGSALQAANVEISSSIPKGGKKKSKKKGKKRGVGAGTGDHGHHGDFRLLLQARYTAPSLPVQTNYSRVFPENSNNFEFEQNFKFEISNAPLQFLTVTLQAPNNEQLTNWQRSVAAVKAQQELGEAPGTDAVKKIDQQMPILGKVDISLFDIRTLQFGVVQKGQFKLILGEGYSMDHGIVCMSLCLKPELNQSLHVEPVFSLEMKRFLADFGNVEGSVEGGPVDDANSEDDTDAESVLLLPLHRWLPVKLLLLPLLRVWFLVRTLSARL
jgi:hypothetical protein